MVERVNGDRALRQVREISERLISAHGESNAQSIAIKLIDHYRQLDEWQREAFFDFLARNFNPDPAKVASIAQAYASDPSASNLIALCQNAEPRRQELLRRINRAPGGTHAIA